MDTETIANAIDIICEMWEYDTSLSYAEMADHLEALIDVIEGESDYETFLVESKIKNKLN